MQTKYELITEIKDGIKEVGESGASEIVLRAALVEILIDIRDILNEGLIKEGKENGKV